MLHAAIYCRISLARFGDTVKVDDQEKISRNLAGTRGWSVNPKHVYRDNSVSAWRRDRKRPGWEAMLDAVERGEINAIIVYHGDRLIRQPWDLELLLRLADERHIQLASPTGERNLSNEDDRFILRIEAAAACREVAATSRRMKRMYERMAEQGRTRLGGRGGRAFGFEPDGLTVRAADADMLCEVANRIVGGEAIGAICRDLNARGYGTAAGNPWAHGSLKRLMCKPRLAGLLARGGVIIGPAVWPAIIERETWEAVVAVLDRRASAFAYTTNARRHLLSGIAECGTCGAPLVIRHNTHSLIGYGCIREGCSRPAHRAQHYLDPYVEGATIERLNNDKIRRRMTETDQGVTADLAVQVAKLRTRREVIFTEFAGDEEMGADVLRVTVRRLDAQIEELQRRIAKAQAPHVLDGLWGIGPTGWGDLPLSQRRGAVGALLRVIVHPATRRGPGFDPVTVELRDR